MSTAVWPPIDDVRLAREQAASQARELEWLLVQLGETLQSLKAGLQECAALLAPSENGSTLVLSSVRSESLKGLITRIGTRITKGVCLRLPRRCPLNSMYTDHRQNIKLRLTSLPPPKGSLTYDLTISSAPHAPTLVVPQLTSIRTSINSCLDAIDVATWGGDATNANFVAGQLQLLHDHILEAQAALKGHSDVQLPWWEDPVDEKVHFYRGSTTVLRQLTTTPDLRTPSTAYCLISLVRLRCSSRSRNPHPRATAGWRQLIIAHRLQPSQHLRIGARCYTSACTRRSRPHIQIQRS